MRVTDLRVLEDQHLARASGGSGGADLLTAPMPGAVAEVRVAPGDRVAAGDTLVVLEAMKLLQSLPAPVAGVVSRNLLRARRYRRRARPTCQTRPGGRNMTKQDTITAANGPFNEDLDMIRDQLRRFIATEVTAKADAWEENRHGAPRRAAPDGRFGRSGHAL